MAVTPSALRPHPAHRRHFPDCCQGLPQGDAAIVRGDALMPVRMETLASQAEHGSFRKVGVLETPAR